MVKNKDEWLNKTAIAKDIKWALEALVNSEDLFEIEQKLKTKDAISQVKFSRKSGKASFLKKLVSMIFH